MEAELPMRGSRSSGREGLTALRWAVLREPLPCRPAAARAGRQTGGALTSQPSSGPWR